MPDFDIDFCQDRRDEVIRYVQQKYGRDRVAQIITFGTLQARAVLRDVGRVLRHALRPGRPAVASWCRTIRPTRSRLDKALDGEPRLQRGGRRGETGRAR